MHTPVRTFLLSLIIPLSLVAGRPATLAGSTAAPNFPTTPGAYHSGGEGFAVRLTLQPTYSVSGQITAGGQPLAGVMVSAGSFITTTDSTGAYTLSGLPPGTYTLMPSKPDYTFTPPTRQVIVNGDVSGQDFSGTVGYTVSGQVKDSNGQTLLGVVVSAGGGYRGITELGGNYGIGPLPPGTYTLTPFKRGYTFTPPTRQVVVNSDVAEQDFTAQACPLQLPLILGGLAAP